MPRDRSSHEPTADQNDMLGKLSGALSGLGPGDAQDVLRRLLAAGDPFERTPPSRRRPRRPGPVTYRARIDLTGTKPPLWRRLEVAVNARGHFPTEQAAMKCLYLALMSLDPTGKGRQRWTNRWKPALNAFDIAFDGRITADRK